jgi:hypothetical protein
MKASSELRAGDWVRVRSREEILRTLDKNGQLEGLPFMPEMFAFCGQRLRVFKRAHKTCDPPNGLAGRRMLRAVHLEGARCNGDAHGGCQARCLVFWKEAWLEKVDAGEIQNEAEELRQSSLHSVEFAANSGCSEDDVWSGTRSRTCSADSDNTVFICQSTHLSQATQPLRWWDVRQYVEDYTSGNVSFFQLLSAFVFFLYEPLVSAGLGLGSPLRWAYDALQKMAGNTPYPLRRGKISRGERTPSAKLDLQAGELVKVRSYPEILSTIDDEGRNRGMWFDAEMVPFCGGTYRVLDRISRIINEKTGKIQHLKNDCIMLDQVVCRACYAKYRRFCPRSIYPYWREVWMERAEPATRSAQTSTTPSSNGLTRMPGA